jgi:6-phosphogluconolactonase
MHRIAALLAVAAAALAVAAIAAAGNGAVYTLTNSPAANAVAVFDRAPDGTLTAAGTVATGGRGTGANLGSAESIVLADDGRLLVAVDAGSNTISALAVGPHGLAPLDTVPAGGTLPISVAVHGSLVYALDAGSNTISGFVVGQEGLTPLADSTRSLSPGAAGPAQIQFGPEGRTLVVTEKASRSIDTFVVGLDGRAGPANAYTSTGVTPFGFDIDRQGHVLVSNAGGSTASSYALARDGSLTPVSDPVANGQVAACWLVATKDGRFAYTANAGNGTISGYAVGPDGSLSLLDGGLAASTGAGSHPLDEAVAGDGRFLYVLADGFHTIQGFRIAADGSLTAVGAAGALPAGSVGVAAR